MFLSKFPFPLPPRVSKKPNPLLQLFDLFHKFFINF